MLRIVRNAAPVSLVLVLFLQAGALAATVQVDIQSFSYSPDPASIAPLDTVRWTNRDGVRHSATSDGAGAVSTNPDGSPGLGLWDSPNLSTNQSYQFTFRGAGTFPYHCDVHPDMRAEVRVPPVAVPASGSVGDTFTIYFAQADPGPFGFRFDVQKMDPGGTFQDYQLNVTTRSVTFTPGASGTYQFRVRPERTTSSGRALYSPAVSISVSG